MDHRAHPAYGQSKLANLLFALELDRRLRAAGSATKSSAAHPGYAKTNLRTTRPPGIDQVLMLVPAHPGTLRAGRRDPRLSSRQAGGTSPAP